MSEASMDRLLNMLFQQLSAEDSDEFLLKDALPALVQSLDQQQETTLRNQQFSIDKADLYFRKKLSDSDSRELQKIIRKQKEGKTDESLRGFIREVPVRTTQVAGSVPIWAAGAKLVKSIGPIGRIDGRKIIVDFFRVTRLVKLFAQNDARPILLFSSSFTKGRFQIGDPPIPLQNNYAISAGTVWVRADMIAPGAPSDRYCGLAVADGSVRLSAAPFTSNNQLTVAGPTRVTLELSLNNTPVPETQPPGNAGLDAFHGSISLPKKAQFLFAATGIKEVQSVGQAGWKVYGHKGSLAFAQVNGPAVFNPPLSRVCIPMGYVDGGAFSPNGISSPLLKLSGAAEVQSSWWALPAAQLDTNQPLEAAGAGALVILLQSGLKAAWTGMSGRLGRLINPFFILEQDRIGITDLQGDWLGANHTLKHWRDAGMKHPTEVILTMQQGKPLLYNCMASGQELLMTLANTEVLADRPVKANGLPLAVKTKDSLVMMACDHNTQAFSLIDDNILWDYRLPFEKVPQFSPQALVLENAVFTVSPVNGCLIFGETNADFTAILNSQTFFSVGLVSFLPILPDPYLARYDLLREQLANTQQGLASIKSWLVCRIVQKPQHDNPDSVRVSFHQVAPATPGAGTPIPGASASPQMDPLNTDLFSVSQAFNPIENQGPEALASKINPPLPDYEDQYKEKVAPFEFEFFAMLDISSHANQLGVSMGAPLFRSKRTGGAAITGENEATIVQDQGNGGLMVEGMQVLLPGAATRLFMLPQVAWEPVFNLTAIPQPMPGDPPVGLNYYPNDGGASRIFNDSGKPVGFAPIPLVKFLAHEYKQKTAGIVSQFTLPFGMKAVASLSHNNPDETIKPGFSVLQPEFPDDLTGGIQLKTVAGNYGKKDNTDPSRNDSPMFAGFSVQINNVLDTSGNPTGASTLAHTPTEIFNGEFFMDQANPGVLRQRGVPVSRIDFTGYGSSMFSNWVSPQAAIAQTSQARFDVMLGRTGHEVVQVKSIVYPWGIRVVRTITIFRLASGYIMRTDSGWQAETDGRFDFRYQFEDINGQQKIEMPYKLHPGTVSGLFDISNIREDPSIEPYTAVNSIGTNTLYINEKGKQVQNFGAPFEQQVKCIPVWFDANVQIENTVQGHRNGRVPCKKILGYVQTAPPGIPLTSVQLKALLAIQGGSIGGDTDCVVNVNQSGQQMRISRFDISASPDAANSPLNPVFVVAIRGSVLLPKDGSWSMVQHNVLSGEVIPVAAALPIPLIRIGEWVPGNVINPAAVANQLLRIANPEDLLRAPQLDSIHFGMLQTTATQKALFLTPAFGKGVKTLLSKTPPLFADAYRLMTGNGIFPNIGNAVDNFGQAAPLMEVFDQAQQKVKAFQESALTDGGKKVMELMAIKAQKAGEAVVDQGFELLAKKANAGIDRIFQFDFPPTEIDLVDMDGLRIYIEYKTGPKSGAPNQYVSSKLDFDVQSLASDLGDRWKSRLNNLGMVVDLGSFSRLMTIKGNFNAQKGKESGYEGGDGPFGGLPVPEIEFSDELKPIIELLQMLASLSTGDYGDVMKRGLKVAMSNAGEIWEYKFEAGKEIPLVRFPPTNELYNSPQTPLKLEASLGLGVSFNAALKLTTDPKQLLPSAGAFIQFKGGLQVMCASLGGATIYAVGAVELKVACDTARGPSLFMKFGFGATIVVGLPVVGSVSVLIMVGCELEADLNSMTITAFLLFKGHASLIGGLVSVTIYIEARGTVKRIGDRTDCKAQVTFGLDISIFLIINISFEETWEESRQIA